MGKRRPAPCHVYGAAALSHALYGVVFPKTKQELIDMHGERYILLVFAEFVVDL